MITSQNTALSGYAFKTIFHFYKIGMFLFVDFEKIYLHVFTR